MQERRNSITNALELRLSGTNSSIWSSIKSSLVAGWQRVNSDQNFISNINRHNNGNRLNGFLPATSSYININISGRPWR